jgi:hypothetical protein
VQEEPDPAGGLLPDYSRLPDAVGARQQQAGYRAGRPHDHPPLGAPVIGQRRAVLDELETQYVHEEADRRVVLPDHHGHLVEIHG